MENPRPAPQGSNLARRAARGGGATLLGQGIRILLQVGSVAVLARLIDREDFGLFAMAMTFVALSEIFRDFGLSNAAIQAPSLSVRERDQLFWANTAIGATLAVLIAAGSPLLELIFGQAGLAPLAVGLAASFILNGIQTQYRVSLNRSLRLGALAIIDVAAPLAGAVAAILAASAGWGAWALVLQLNVTAATGLLLLMPTAGWLPGRPRRGVPLGHFLRFGGTMVASQLVNFAAGNIDTLLIGRLLGTGPLGIYNRGSQLLMTPLTQLRAPLSRVAIPVLSRLQDDTRRFADFLCRGQLLLGYTILPLLAFVAGASVPIVTVFLGPSWIDAAPVLTLLAVAGAFQTLAYVAYWGYVSQGLTGALLRFTFMSASLKIVCVLIGSTGGIVGVAAGVAAEPILSWPMAIWWLSRSAPTPVARLYAGVARLAPLAILAGLAAAGTAHLTAEAGPLLAILAAGGSVLAVYALGAVLPVVRRDLLDLRRTVTLMLSREPAPAPSTPPAEALAPPAAMPTTTAPPTTPRTPTAAAPTPPTIPENPAR